MYFFYTFQCLNDRPNRHEQHMQRNERIFTRTVQLSNCVNSQTESIVETQHNTTHKTFENSENNSDGLK